MSTAVTIPRDLPDGETFVARSLSSSGAVYGSPLLDQATVSSAADRRLLRVGPTGSTPTLVGNEVDPWSLQAGQHVVAWLQHVDDQHNWQVICHQVTDRDRRQLSETGGSALSVDRDVIVWTDDNDPLTREPGDPPPETVWVSSGCQDRRPLEVQGYIQAFSYPYVFVADFSDPPIDRTVHQVDVRTGRTVATHALPRGLKVDDYLQAAANRDLLVWVDERSLFITDRGTGRSRQVANDLPHATGVNGDKVLLTAGSRLIAYWTNPIDGDDPYTAESVVYDPRSDTTIRLPGDALAAGNWLLWSEGRDYRLAGVR